MRDYLIVNEEHIQNEKGSFETTFYQLNESRWGPYTHADRIISELVGWSATRVVSITLVLAGQSPRVLYLRKGSLNDSRNAYLTLLKEEGRKNEVPKGKRPSV